MDFKERVKNILIEEAQNYKTIFLDYDYLLCSEIFVNSPYYIIIAKDWNFLHLTGVHPLNFSATDFFIKCLDKTLGTNDFDFNKVETIWLILCYWRLWEAGQISWRNLDRLKTSAHCMPVKNF